MSVSWLVRPIQETLLARQGAAALSGLSSGEEALLILYYVTLLHPFIIFLENLN